VAHSLSAKKRIRQNLKRRMRNRARKSQMKTHIRRFLEAVTARDLERAEAEFRTAVKKIDQIAAKGTIHRNAAARKKARLQRSLNALRAAARRAQPA